MEPRIVEKPAFTLVGFEIRTTLAEQKESADELLQRLRSPGVVDSIQHKASAEAHVILSKDWGKDGSFLLFIGVVVTSASGVPPGASVLSVPTAKYAVFTAVGELPAASEEAWKAIQEWGKTPNLQPSAAVMFEIHDARSRRGASSETDIYVPRIPG